MDASENSYSLLFFLYAYFNNFSLCHLNCNLKFMPTLQPKLFTLRADTMSKTHQWVCGGILLGIGVFLLILIGAAMPNLVDKFDGEDCDNLMVNQRNGVFCNKLNFNNPLTFNTFVMDIGSYNQFLMVKAIPMKAYLDEQITVKEKIRYQMIIDEIRDDLIVTKTVKVIEETSAEVTCDFSNTKDNTCSDFVMLTLPQIDPGNYRLSIQITNNRQLSQYMTGLRLENYQINSKYYASFLGVKYTFFAISLVVMCFFATTYAKTPKTMRVFEQDAILLLLLFVILFNDPLVYVNVVKPSKFSIFISVLCTVMFVAYVLYFWMVLFEVGFVSSREFTRRTV
jgi:Wnt-binding factor required for Wnt secretion